MSVIAWIVTEGDKHFLCVLEPPEGAEQRKNYRFPINLHGLARLSAETSAPVMTALQRFGVER